MSQHQPSLRGVAGASASSVSTVSSASEAREGEMDKNRVWLGEDMHSWFASMLNGYARMHVTFALHEVGVFEVLRRAGGAGMTLAEIASECKLHPRLLKGVLSYLALADEILEKDGERFTLRSPSEWLFEDLTHGASLVYVGAYSCLFSTLLPALRGELLYGRDFVRADDMVARGSYIATRANYPWIVEELSSLGVEVVADLGCGAAQILIDLCHQCPKLRAVGIDISPAAVAEARKTVAGAGLGDRIRILEDDITRPDEYASEIGDVEAFNAAFVLHEFLRDGEEAVTEILRKMKRLFPGRYLVLTEFDAPSDEEYRALDHPQRIFMLFYQHVVHPLSWQGLPIATKTWHGIFDRAGLQLIKVKTDHPYRLHVHLARF